MTAEETLRNLAEHQRRLVKAATPEYQDDLIRSARPFLTGAMLALVSVGALDSSPAKQLLEELLAPIEQPLVDAGKLDRTKITVKVQEATSLIRSLHPKPEQ